MRAAITRPVSSSLAAGERTCIDRTPIDLDVARRQHAAYCDALASCGCEILTLPGLDDLPDAVFVEDAAVVFDELAVITRSGAASRRAEVDDVQAALAPYRMTVRVVEPATLDGGDVIVGGRTVFVGRSTRTNEHGFAQMEAALAPLGYDVRWAPVRECLHLKSAATFIGEGAVLVNPAWTNVAVFAGFRIVEVDPGEPDGANALRVGGKLIHAAAYPQTAYRLRAAGFEVVPVDISELAKAEGAVTCSSLIVEASSSMAG